MIQSEKFQRLLSNSYSFCFTRDKYKMEVLHQPKMKLSEFNISFDTRCSYEKRNEAPNGSAL
jgi:hypothetical protein